MFQIKNINSVVTKMERYDKKNIITAQREISVLQKKLEECEEEIMSGGSSSKVPAAAPRPTIGE